MAVQSAVIIANLDKDHAAVLADKIKSFLIEKKVVVNEFRYKGIPLGGYIPNVDFAVVLGGDGTVLYASSLLQGRNIPILGFNLGTLGFITEFLAEEWKTALSKYLLGELRYSERLILKGIVERDTRAVYEFQALNDCVISGCSSSRMIYCDVQLTGVLLGHYRADGIIIATPTGSTAYSLSAGGPILHPETPAMIFTPICPHSLSHRSLVLPPTEEISVLINEGQRIPISLTADGREVFSLQENDRIIIKKLESSVLLVKTDMRSFYEVVHAKLN